MMKVLTAGFTSILFLSACPSRVLNKQAKKKFQAKTILTLTTLISFYLTPSLAIENVENIIIKKQHTPWEIWRTDKKLSVSYRMNTFNNLIEVKANATLQSTSIGFICFIEDLPQISNWLDNAESAELISKISNNESIFITRFKGFWPLTTRDIVVHSRYWQNPDLSLEIVISDAGESITKNKDTIRMQVISAYWKIVPTQLDHINISYQSIVDPKGNIPQWLAKTITLNSIWTTLVNLKVQLPTSLCQLNSNDGN